MSEAAFKMHKPLKVFQSGSKRHTESIYATAKVVFFYSSMKLISTILTSTVS